MTKTAKPKITPKMTLGEIVANYPETIEIFFKYGLPCAGCHVSSVETLEEGAMGHGIAGKEFKKLVDDLNKAAR